MRLVNTIILLALICITTNCFAGKNYSEVGYGMAMSGDVVYLQPPIFSSDDNSRYEVYEFLHKDGNPHYEDLLYYGCKNTGEKQEYFNSEFRKKLIKDGWKPVGDWRGKYR